MRVCLFSAVLLLAFACPGAERRFDFSQFPENETPPGFRSTVWGLGKPGDWKVVMDNVPSALPALTPQAPSTSKKAVLAQLSQDRTDEHFPMLIFDGEVFDNFTLTTKFKTVTGSVEQMAGIAFRIQNETNFYVLRASSLGHTLKWYKVVNGARIQLLGPDVQIPSGTWHEMSIVCEGPNINCLLDGQQAIPTITDTTFSRGKFGFWTKSDSVSYFQDTKILYKPREVPAQVLVRDTMKNYGRLLGLKIFLPSPDQKTTSVIASKDEQDLGQPGAEAELNAIRKANTYYQKTKEWVSVIMPLRDRNGDPIASVRVIMQTFRGQTEENALSRATPIVKDMQKRVRSLEDLQ